MSVPPTRLVTLGASNLTRVLPTLIELAQVRAGGPIDVLAALGLGRSFGLHSRFVARVLPGIGGCGLWDELAAAPAAPSVGIVMDVGNDILYGVDVPVLVDWVDRALARLRGHVDRLVLAGLPLPGVRRIGALRFGLVRTVLVPSCRVSLVETLRRAEQVQAALEERARAHGAEFFPMQPAWYGFDPIHVRRRFWRELCAGLLGIETPPASTAPLRRAMRRLQVCTAVPASRRLFGFDQRRAQPSRRLADGTTLSTF